MKEATFTLEDSDAIKAISSRIPGWSGAVQYLFFKSLLADRLNLKRLLMLGVYHGRDIAFILDILTRYHPGREMTITGVDKFNAEPCDDWPQEKRGMTWEQAFNCPPPDHQSAISNTRSNLWQHHVSIWKMDDVTYLHGKCTPHDCVYLDTSHDYETVKRQLEKVPSMLAPGGIICGDDYSDEGQWGVKRAVSQALPTHSVFRGWIWYASAPARQTVLADVIVNPIGNIGEPTRFVVVEEKRRDDTGDIVATAIV